MRAKFDSNTIFDIKGLAKALGRSDRQIRRMIKSGDIPKPKKTLGNRYVWTGSELIGNIGTADPSKLSEE